MSDFKKIVTGMKKNFAEAKETIDEKRKQMQTPLPEGEYIARLQGCSIKKSKSSVNYYIQLIYWIMEGEEKGKVAYDNFMTIIPENSERITRFFQRFELDTDLLQSDDVAEVIEQYCTRIHQASPIVRLNVKHWSNDEGKEGINIYLNKVIEGLDESLPTNDVDINDSIEDDLELIDNKPELKKIIFDENLDISPVKIVKFSIDELKDAIRTCRKSEMIEEETVIEEEENQLSSEEEDLRQRLIALCESQGIEEINSESTIEEIKTVIDEDKDCGYQFVTEGDDALTNEEIETLIDAGLDQKIVEMEKPKPVKKSSSKVQAKKIPTKTIVKKGGKK